MKYDAAVKVCRSCARELPLSSFYTHPETADRRFASCKRCVCDRQKAARVPERIEDRHRLASGGMYLLGVWPLQRGGVCMAHCNARASVAVLALELGATPVLLRLCDVHYRLALVGPARN